MEEPTSLRRPLVVLLDASGSMGLPSSRGDASRFEAARKVLDDPGLKQGLAGKYDLKVYTFDRETTLSDLDGLAGAAPEGDASRLFRALERVTEDEPEAAGVVVVSDGIVNPAGAIDEFKGHPRPVLAVGVGQPEGFRDLRIAGLRAPELAFRGRAATIDFTIQAYGMAGVQVPLYFNLGRNLVSTHPITIDRDPYENRITLNYTPRDLGAHGFTLTLPEQSGEIIAGNNRKAFHMEVRRDKIRVLTLSGSPSWNYRFLRFALKQDPFLELVSFVFLRTPNDVVDVRENELSLIPFPIDEIFVEELKNFDVLILDDFSYRTYFNPLYFENIRDFVRDGGGMAMLGGSRAFDRGGYHQTALNPVLPVKLDGHGAFRTGVAARAGLTEAGKAHPLTRVFADPDANEQAWRALPPLTTLNEVARANGEVLLSARFDGRQAPLLTVGRYHEGRTLAFASDDLWRWNFDAVGRNQNPPDPSEAHSKRRPVAGTGARLRPGPDRGGGRFPAARRKARVPHPRVAGRPRPGRRTCSPGGGHRAGGRAVAAGDRGHRPGRGIPFGVHPAPGGLPPHRGAGLVGRETAGKRRRQLSRGIAVGGERRRPAQARVVANRRGTQPGHVRSRRLVDRGPLVGVRATDGAGRAVQHRGQKPRGALERASPVHPRGPAAGGGMVAAADLGPGMRPGDSGDPFMTTHVFSGNPLDRGDVQRRDEEWLRKAARDPGSRFLPLWQLDILLRNGERAELGWVRSLRHIERPPGSKRPPGLSGPHGRHRSLRGGHVSALPEPLQDLEPGRTLGLRGGPGRRRDS